MTGVGTHGTMGTSTCSAVAVVAAVPGILTAPSSCGLLAWCSCMARWYYAARGLAWRQRSCCSARLRDGTAIGTDTGGSTRKCLSGVYCCGEGLAWWEAHVGNRSKKAAEFTKLPRSLFGGKYLEVFAARLTDYFNGRLGVTAPTAGRFLDVGGTFFTSLPLSLSLSLSPSLLSFSLPLFITIFWGEDRPPDLALYWALVACNVVFISLLHCCRSSFYLPLPFRRLRLLQLTCTSRACLIRLLPPLQARGPLIPG